MTPEQRRLVRESYPHIQAAEISIGLLFYGRLFDLDPSLRPLFRNDIRAQTRKLMDMLETVVANPDRFDEIRPAISDLGLRHATAYGVKPEHYRTLQKTLIWAFGQALETAFYPDVREAWTAVIGAVNSIMIAGADTQESSPPT